MRTNNAERMRVTSSGLVGIGTLGSAASLHVNQSANDGTDVLVTSPEFARMRMVAEAPSVDVTLSLQARGQSTASWAEIGTLSNHDVVRYTNGNVLMFPRQRRSLPGQRVSLRRAPACSGRSLRSTPECT